MVGSRNVFALDTVRRHLTLPQAADIFNGGQNISLAVMAELNLLIFNPDILEVVCAGDGEFTVIIESACIIRNARCIAINS